MSKDNQQGQQPENRPQLNMSAAPDLDYKYRDLFNVHVSAEDVLLEFGNLHRSQPGSAVLLDRIVLSPGNAIRLQQALAQAINQMQQKIREMATQKPPASGAN